MSLLLYVVQYSDHTRSHAFCPPEFTIFGPISYNVLRMEEVGGTSEERRRDVGGTSEEVGGTSEEVGGTLEEDGGRMEG